MNFEGENGHPTGGTLTMEESEVRNLIDLAVAALNEGDHVRALAIGDQLAAEAPDRASIRAIRAQALLEGDSPAESYEEARRAVALAPDDEHAHRLLAMSAWRSGRLSAAQEAFERAIELCRQSPVLLCDYAWFMATERSPKLAKEAADAAIEADPTCSTAWAALGRAQYRLHRREQAEAAVRRALELNPNDLYAQSAMVPILQDRRDDRQAEALANLISEHAGTEDLVESVRDTARKRQIERMLVERKVDVDPPPPELRGRFWVWAVAVATLVGVVFAVFGLRPLPIVLVGAVLLLIVLHRLID